MKNFFYKKICRQSLIPVLLFFSNTSVSAQTPHMAQIEAPKTGMEIILFFGLLLFMLLAPAFKKREWPKLRKEYSYFID